MSGLGMIQVYTGDGKGKTTASIGLAFRACGHGLKVHMIQFMKENTDYGEMKAVHYLPGFEITQVGRNDFVNLSCPEDIDKKLARDGWDFARSIIMSAKYDIIILDEINVATACKLLDAQEIVDLLTNERTTLDKVPEIILTGRYAPKEFIEIADLVTEMKEIRHPFRAGVESRQGADY